MGIIINDNHSNRYNSVDTTYSSPLTAFLCCSCCCCPFGVNGNDFLHLTGVDLCGKMQRPARRQLSVIYTWIGVCDGGVEGGGGDGGVLHGDPLRRSHVSYRLTSFFLSRRLPFVWPTIKNRFWHLSNNQQPTTTTIPLNAVAVSHSRLMMGRQIHLLWLTILIPPSISP